VVVDNELHLFPKKRLSGKAKITIDQHLINILDKPLYLTSKQDIDFGKVNPAIEIKGKGVILPSAAGLILPFKAVNLKSLDMKIFKIYENNVHQFLQDNELDGKDELRRVSLPVAVKKISLATSGAAQLNKWNHFSIDLADYITVEPGAIYRVVFNFSREDAYVDCGNSTAGVDATLSNTKNSFEEEAENSSFYSEYEYNYEEDYDWRERNNPCNSAFYEQNAVASRNVLASDLGILAKGSASGDYLFAINDIKTTDPLANVTIELYNFQRQLISTLTTDNNGLAKVILTKKPFLLVAKYGTQRGYLKMDDGNSLSISNFNVAGEQIQKGLKGFMYGERGVWRPGDSLFVTFVLDDENNTLPKGHPVIFEVYNPLNQLVKKLVKSANVNHFYTFKFKTNADAPTGNWLANVKVGSSVFTKILRIETIKPNRLKINLDFGKTSLSFRDNPLKANLKVNWLHGLPAANLKAEFELIFTRSETKFDKYPNFIFDDATKAFESEPQSIYSGKLNQEGLAKLNVPIAMTSAAPGRLTAIFKGRIFEEGGDVSIDRITMPYYPYPTYVGMNLPEPKNGVYETNANHVIKLAVVDEKGKSFDRNSVEVEVYKLSWRWWWEHSDDDAYFIGNNLSQPVKRDHVNLSNGSATYTLNMPNNAWGRYLIRVTDPVSGHATSQVIFMDSYNGGSRAAGNGAEWATMLSFAADKDKYTVGENIQLNIPSSEGGRVLVSLENGTKVLKTFWVNTTKGQTRFSFKATPEMSPNVYAHVTLLQPYKNTVNDLPIRMYGIVPLSIEDPTTHLNPVLVLPKVIKPSEKVTLQVFEKQGNEMTYTIAMVDEGLLDITKFKTPNPWEAFFAHEALGVKTWDLYDFVCGAYGGKLNKILAVGGDGMLKNPDGTKANRFKPVVKYLGPFVLKKGETAKHTIQMPNYVGSVRTMVIAGNPKGAYGNAEVTTPVRQSVMVLSSLPRVLGPEEEVLLPVTVFANEPQVKNVTVSLAVNGMFTILGAAKVAIKFDKIGEKMVYFKLKTKRAIGLGKVKVVANAGNLSIPFETEIAIRNPNNRIAAVNEFVINPGKTVAANFQAIGMGGTNKYTLEVSTMPAINLSHRLDYLMQYPHGCIEQTTSSVFPQLYLAEILDLNPAKKTEIERNIKAAIEKLQSFQTSSGGFSYWPKGQEADEWGSNYAGHFLVEAQKKGFLVPSTMLKAWKQYQNTLAASYVDLNNPTYKTNIQAYRLYVLAIAGSPNLGAMNRMREQKRLPVLAKWELAASYVSAGQVEIGKMIADAAPMVVDNYTELAFTYGSGDRDRAVILEVLVLLNEKVKAVNLLKSIAAQLSTPKWMSTQTTAYCLFAVGKFLTKFAAKSPVSVQYTLNKKAMNLQSEAKQMASSTLVVHETTNNQMSITNTGKGLVYVRIVGSGIPWNNHTVAGASGLTMETKFKNLKGEMINAADLKQGTDFMAEVTLTNQGLRGHLRQLALTQVFAAGWEISNTRMDEKAALLQLAKPDYIDFRDDRVWSYFDLGIGEKKTFRILLNASFVGKFFLPMFNCEAMYDNTIYARNTGQWVMVR
jgi:uncharacterized protein YfaS (alpha-2-macroglobulin family)